jgi:hypothetical protein
MSLTQDRDTKARPGDFYQPGVAANALIYAGALVCLNANGYATPGAAALGLNAIGRCEGQADNTGGADGAITVSVMRGVFRFANSAGGDAITEANVGERCYVVDDQAVALTNGVGTRSQAGVIFDVDAQGVWVDMRNPLDARKVYVAVEIANLIGANAKVYHVAAPVAGRITKITTDLNAVLATGDATVTAKIAGVAVTNGVVDIVQAGSAAGQINTVAPTALNAFDVGTDISFTVGGTNTAASDALLIFEITR